MPRYRPPAAIIAAFVLLLVVIAQGIAHSAGSVQTPAHLEVHPAPPYVRTAATLSPGTTATVSEAAWVARVDCSTGATIATLGLATLNESGNAGPRTIRSHDVQARAGDCLVPAAFIAQGSTVLVSSVGPTYRF
jgi:hypothetical protein